MKAKKSKKKSKTVAKVKAKKTSGSLKAKSKATTALKSKAKSKSKSKSKLKSKAKITPKSKPKLKTQAVKKTTVKKAAKKAKSKKPVKAASKVKAKSKAKPTAKVTTKSKAKRKTKSPVKTKAKSAKKPVSKAPKQKSKAASGARHNYNQEQKEKLLQLIELVVNIRRGQRGGLGSFETIDRILDEFNQHYPDIHTKFDAIAEYGLKKDPAFLPKNAFIPTANKNENEVRLYALLEGIWNGEVEYQVAYDQMNGIYINSLSEKDNHHFENESEENEYE